jgi:deoxyadenosine/deoxycytidine kinase
MKLTLPLQQIYCVPYSAAKNQKMKVIALEGLIGAGKSFLLKKISALLSDNTEIKIIEEPVHLFQQFECHNPLALLYSNPYKYAGFAQLHILRMQASFFRQKLDEYADAKVVVTERSLHAPILFTKSLASMGYISSFERDMLIDEATKNPNEILPLHPLGGDYVYYLNTPQQKCLNHIAIRQREQETNMSSLYLDALKEEYAKYLDKIDKNSLRYLTFGEDVKSFADDILKIANY